MQQTMLGMRPWLDAGTDCKHFVTGLPFASVIIECSSQWIGIPDVRFEKIAEPITNIDYGGGTDPPKFPKRFSDVSMKVEHRGICFLFISCPDHLLTHWQCRIKKIFFHGRG